MDVGILNQAGEILVHQQMNASPDTWLRTMAPYREDLVVAVVCLVTWSWLADLWAQAGMPVVLGHARSMHAIHGGNAQHDPIDAQNIAVLLRGGRLPQASVDPSDRRATRDRLQPRMHLMRNRAARLTHVQHTKSQDNLPQMGRKIADQTNRAGVAERGAEPAVHTSIDVDLALRGHTDAWLRDVERSILNAATPPDANTRSRLRTVPGSGEMLRLVRRSAMHDLPRVPRVQAFVSSGRLVTCATASAGTRDGPSGTKIGHASLSWAFSKAAWRCRRAKPAGQQDLGRLEPTHGQGKAWTVLAHKRARAVYDLWKRDPAFERHQSSPARGSGASEPGASRALDGRSLGPMLWQS